MWIQIIKTQWDLIDKHRKLRISNVPTIICIAIWDGITKRGKVYISLTGLITSILLCMAQTRTYISRFPESSFLIFVFNDLRWEVVVRFCWYWRNCWPLLFKLSLYKVWASFSLIWFSVITIFSKCAKCEKKIMMVKRKTKETQHIL